MHLHMEHKHALRAIPPTCTWLTRGNQAEDGGHEVLSIVPIQLASSGNDDVVLLLPAVLLAQAV